MLEISALASGSSGNCFYISNGENSVLIDAGVSRKQIVKRLEKINRSAKSIDGIFVTHEHGDHIAGTDVFARKYNVPIYATKKTIKERDLCSNKDLIQKIKTNSSICIGDLEIESFEKFHDSVDPVSFNVISDRKISIMTDLGKICRNVENNIKDCHAVFLESNHDKKMLKEGPYPKFLKERIRGKGGHVSNKEAVSAVLQSDNENLKHLILSHLSENNNTPKKALESFSVLKENKKINAKISISGRYKPTKIFEV